MKMDVCLCVHVYETNLNKKDPHEACELKTEKPRALL